MDPPWGSRLRRVLRGFFQALELFRNHFSRRWNFSCRSWAALTPSASISGSLQCARARDPCVKRTAAERRPHRDPLRASRSPREAPDHSPIPPPRTSVTSAVKSGWQNRNRTAQHSKHTKWAGWKRSFSPRRGGRQGAFAEGNRRWTRMNADGPNLRNLSGTLGPEPRTWDLGPETWDHLPLCASCGHSVRIVSRRRISRR